MGQVENKDDGVLLKVKHNESSSDSFGNYGGLNYVNYINANQYTYVILC